MHNQSDSDFSIQVADTTAFPVFKDLRNLIPHDFNAVVVLISWEKESVKEIGVSLRHKLNTGESRQARSLTDSGSATSLARRFAWQIVLPSPHPRATFQPF
jgi:hypothetical protein